MRNSKFDQVCLQMSTEFTMRISELKRWWKCRGVAMEKVSYSNSVPVLTVN